MDTIDTVIIGGGVVGLAVGARLSNDGREAVVVERHDGFGRETSSRNSEVIHAGLYYPSGSLKAGLCVQGNRMLYELCARHNIPHRKTGKLIVGSTPQERAKIHHLLEQGEKNGVAGLRLLTKKGIVALEPAVRADEGLYSPETGIIDTHQLMAFFQREIEARNGIVSYQCAATAIERTQQGYRVTVLDADHQTTELGCACVVNAAGLSADAVSAMAGIDVDACGYRIHPCKGEYFSVSPRHKGALSHLVYPAPTPISLGVHAVLKLDGSLKFGPNAFYVEALDYDVDPAHQREFYEQASCFFPFISHDDLSPDMSGIRPKLQWENEDFHDFVIRDESDKGLPGFINLVGIESPGLTAAPAIADYVAGILNGK